MRIGRRPFLGSTGVYMIITAGATITATAKVFVGSYTPRRRITAFTHVTRQDIEIM